MIYVNIKTPLVLAKRFSVKKLKIKNTNKTIPNTFRLRYRLLQRCNKNAKKKDNPTIPEEIINSMY